MHSNQVIIIGSGIAGMAAAVRLACAGYQVSVYEKNAYPGGKLSVFEKDGYRFDAGPSLFTQPVNIEDLFETAGEPIADYFSYSAVDTACRYFFENGKTIDAFTDAELFSQELSEKTGEDPAAVKKYLKESEKLYNNIGSIFLQHSLHKKNTWFNKRVIRALGSVRFPYLFSTLNKYNVKKFRSPESIQIFNRYATYNGSNPFKAPGMLSLIPHLEQNQGTFYPKGGMISITNALYHLALKKGVTFHFNQAVERIIHHEGKAHGIVVDGKNIHANIIVSNGDIYFTYKNLLHHPVKAKKILKQERSSSAVIFYWGIGKSFPGLGLHNILFSNSYKEEFDNLFTKGLPGTDPTVYINITSKMEEGHAPVGKENWFVMVNAPANSGQDWEKLKSTIRQRVIEKINRILQIDLEPLIETEEVLDPVLIEERTGSYMGSLYGTSSNTRFAAFLRPANFTSYIKGLYFCGGSVHPGGGIPLCFNSAKITASLIGKDFKNRDTHLEK
ncbi:MAG TPA: phytoene desaturase family protein [Ferruginibacter sp.]|mgnify:FL=1|nr:phytoene desaturase family protein [Ferruginibacter sp.]